MVCPHRPPRPGITEDQSDSIESARESHSSDIGSTVPEPAEPKADRSKWGFFLSPSAESFFAISLPIEGVLRYILRLLHRDRASIRGISWRARVRNFGRDKWRGPSSRGCRHLRESNLQVNPGRHTEADKTSNARFDSQGSVRYEKADLRSCGAHTGIDVRHAVDLHHGATGKSAIAERAITEKAGANAGCWQTRSRTAGAAGPKGAAPWARSQSAGGAIRPWRLADPHFWGPSVSRSPCLGTRTLAA